MLPALSIVPSEFLGGISLFKEIQASTEGNEIPVLHDPSLALLEAAINSDPNPTKGETPVTLSEGSALVANSGPDGTIDHENSNAVENTGSITVYTVKEGDSLSEIASSFNISINTILWANSIKDPKTVRPGTKLVILPVSGITHKVLKGETLGSLAKKYAADADDIASFNGIEEGGALVAGVEVIIPGGELAKTTTVAKKTTSTTKIKTGGSLSQLKNPYKGGSGVALKGYYSNPVPGGSLSQGIHGWNAVDLRAPNGTPVYAAAEGTVIVSKVDGWNGGYGTYVVLSHSNGTQTLYSHLSSDVVSVGDTVAKGARIGSVGITGQATGYHLHFEVRGAKNPFGG